MIKKKKTEHTQKKILIIYHKVQKLSQQSLLIFTNSLLFFKSLGETCFFHSQNISMNTSFFHFLGSLVISSLTYNTTSGFITCISTGGPATTVTWSRSGSSYQQSKIVVDPITATYHNLLTFTSSQISEYSGTFNCTVSNSRDSYSMVTGLYEGK